MKNQVLPRRVHLWPIWRPGWLLSNQMWPKKNQFMLSYFIRKFTGNRKHSAVKFTVCYNTVICTVSVIQCTVLQYCLLFFVLHIYCTWTYLPYSFVSGLALLRVVLCNEEASGHSLPLKHHCTAVHVHHFSLKRIKSLFLQWYSYNTTLYFSHTFTVFCWLVEA